MASCSPVDVPPHPVGSPVLHVPNPERDLGEVAIRPAGHELFFPVFNRGTAVLEIKRLKASCTCTSAEPTKTVLAPGEAGAIRVRIKPNRAEEKSASVVVETDDPHRPATALTVRWRAIDAIEFDPLSLDLGGVRPGNPVETKIGLIRRNLPEAGVPTRIVATPEDRLAATLEGDGVRLVLTPGEDLGRKTGSVTLILEGGAEKSIPLPVRWRVQDVVEAIPPSLFLGSGPPGREFRREVVLTAEEGRRLDIVRAAFDGLPGGAVWRRIDDRRVLVEIRGALPDTPGAVEATVRIECAAPELRSVTLATAAFVVAEPAAPGGSR